MLRPNVLITVGFVEYHTKIFVPEQCLLDNGIHSRFTEWGVPSELAVSWATLLKDSIKVLL